MNDPTIVAKSYADSTLGDFEQFVDTNLEHYLLSEDSDERGLLAHLGLVKTTGRMASMALWPSTEASTELMAEHLGDVLYYLTAMCSAYGIPLDAVMDTAIEEHIQDDGEDRGNS